VGDYEGHPVIFFAGEVKYAPTVDGKYEAVGEMSPIVRSHGGFWTVKK
jgi:hypothetical protein